MYLNLVSQPTTAGKLTNLRSPHALLRSLILACLVSLVPLVVFTAPAHAEACPNEVFRGSEQHGLSLPDCRAYEQVSPAGKGKNGNDAMVRPGVVGASPSGDGVHYFSTSPFLGAEMLVGEPSPAVTYVSSRGGSGGWVTQSVEPAHTPPVSFGGVLGFDEGLSRVLVQAAGQPLAAGAPAKSSAYYARALPGSAYQLLVSTGGGGGPEASEVALAGFSGDGKHLIFESEEHLAEGAASGENVANLYEIDLETPASEQLSLVGVVPSSGESCSGLACVTPAHGSVAGAGGEDAYLKGGDRSFYTQSAISENGEKVFFEALPSEQLFVRVGGTSTFAVSPGPGPARFLGATPNGEYVFYSEGGRLYDNSLEEPNEALALYRYDTVTHERKVIADGADAAGGSATGTGNVEQNFRYITGVHTESGEFAVGQSIEGKGIPQGDGSRKSNRAASSSSTVLLKGLLRMV